MAEPSIYQDGAPEPVPERLNMAAHAVSAPAQRFGDKSALIVVDGADPGKTLDLWSFSRVDLAVRRAAGALRRAGVGRGDRVLIRLGDVPEFPVAFFGAIAAGAIAMPLSSQLSARELAFIAEDARPTLALLAEDTPEFEHAMACLSVEDLLSAPAGDYCDTGAEDPAFLVYTSGSTGAPKGVLHAHRSIWARRMMRSGWHDMQPGDRVMHAGAFNWTYTLGVGLSDPWSVGATAILNAGDRTPERWGPLARAVAPTIFAAVPGIYRRLLKYGSGLRTDFQSLRHALTAGEKLHPDNLRDWHRETGKSLLESLGMSEVSTYISSSPERQADPGFAGWPQPGRRVAVLDGDGNPSARGMDGELAVDRRDPGLMVGYWRGPNDTTRAIEGDWFRTGDRAIMRHDGAVAYCGREDDLMNAQGYRVSPLEVEEVLLSHPAIAEAGVTEKQISAGLSVIAAWIVPETDRPLTRAAVQSHCERHLAAYKVPREFLETHGVPRGKTGKLLRKSLPEISARLID